MLSRRLFLGSLAAVAAAPRVASGESVPDTARFAHTNYGVRPDRTLGTYAEWRGYRWWADRERPDRLRWAFIDPSRANEPAYDWLQLRSDISTLAPDRDKLWMLTREGWHHFTFAESPFDDTARVVFALAT